jgi:hypothetical protein
METITYILVVWFVSQSSPIEQTYQTMNECMYAGFSINTTEWRRVRDWECEIRRTPSSTS